MRAENDCFIGHFAAANFANYVFLFHGTADFVGHAEAHTHFAGVGGDRSRQPHGIFARDNGLYGTLDYTWGLRVLAEEVRPLCAYIGVGEQNRAFASCADTRKVLVVAITDIDEIR